MRQRVKPIALTAFVVLVALAKAAFFLQPVAAKPAFMDRYRRDPFSRAELSRKCTICHVGRGGGERNNFGEAFEDTGFRITPRLREKFPEMFTRNPR
jgi:hypothetical protein